VNRAQEYYNPRFSNYPIGRFSSITNRQSNLTTGTQGASKWNVKVSILEYPKFSGQARDWIAYERKFLSVASSQGFEHIFQDEEFLPVTKNEIQTYKSDLTFIYDAFQNSWADSMNFYLVEQNKPTKNGRKVYLDAKSYFRGSAVKDAILNENMDELINYKLTPNTFNGAEGYNNKFNDIINSLQQQGHSFTPKLVKSIYLGNIKDKVYENIKDQACTDENLLLADVQSSILRKYLSVVGERRHNAPAYTNKRFVNTQTVQMNTQDEGYLEQDGELFVPSPNDANVREIYAMSGGTAASGFPLIPKELYQALPEEVKLIMKQQHAYYVNKYGKGTRKVRNFKQLSSPNQRSINHTSMKTLHEDQFDDELEEFVDPTNEEDISPTNNDSVLNTFQQFLSQNRSINVSQTTKVLNIPPRVINAHFVKNETYG
jgi:hypothetical protein